MAKSNRTALLFAVLLLAGVVVPALAQNSGEIHGRVLDASDATPLIGANVLLEGTYRGASTDRDGYFRIANLKPGSHTLRISFIGYKMERVSVTARAGVVDSVRVLLQPSAIQMAEIMVTASKQEEEVSRATSSVSVLTSETALRRNALRMDKALESIPGVNMMGENVNIRNSSGYTRGLGSRVLVLLDGVPVLMSDFGNMNWDILPVADMARVEVVKGPASATYGSFALGGVMNIITRKPEPRARFSFRSTTGQYDRPYYDEWKWTGRTLSFNRQDVSFSKQFGTVGVRLSAGRHESTGDRENRHFHRVNATGQISWQPNPDGELVFFGAYARDRRGEFVWSRFENPYLVPPEFLSYRYRHDAFTFYLKYKQSLSDRLELRSRVSYIRQLSGNQFNVPGDFKPAQGPGADIELHSKLRPDLDLTAGIEGKYDAAEQRHFGRHTAITLSPYVQQIWQPLSPLRITAGARIDHYRLLPEPALQTQFVRRDTLVNPLPDGATETHFSPQIGVSYELLPRTVLHAAFGSGIRIPSIAERFMEFKEPLEFIGNHNLRTEKSRSIEFGIRQEIGNFARVEATAFENRYDDLIEPVYVSDLTRFFATFVNIEEARIRGVEVSGRLTILRDFFDLNASATWSDPAIVRAEEFEGIILPFESGDLLSYRPKMIAFVSPTLRLGKFSLAADYSYAARLEREQLQVFKDDDRVPRKQLDLRLSFETQNAWQYRNLMLQLVVRNLLEYHYNQIERNINEARNVALVVGFEF